MANGIILLIDDDQGIRDALCELLSLEGYTVKTAQNGKEGLEILKTMAPPPGLILLDLMMPVMDGMQFRQQQLAEKVHEQIPVILMSAAGQLEEKQKTAQVTAHLKKPMDIEQVLEVVQTYFRT